MRASLQALPISFLPNISDMKKSETIALYRDAFLEGKDEIDRRKFEEKTEDKQYAAIMAWKRRKSLSESAVDNSAAGIIDVLKKARKNILSIQNLSAKDSEKIAKLAEALADDVKNFDLIKKGRRLRELKSQRSSLDREIEILESEGVKEC